MLDENVHAFLSSSIYTHEETCQQASQNCQKFYVDDRKALWQELTNGNRNCGNDAHIAVSQMLECALCQAVDSEKSLIDAVASAGNVGSGALNQLKADLSRNAEFGDANPFLNAILGIAVEANKNMLPENQPFDSQDADEDVISSSSGGLRSFGGSDKPYDYYYKKTIAQIARVSSSGGPRYCKKMMPHFPRIHFGSVEPDSINWALAKDVRDACVANLVVVHKIKCLCKYMYWGEKKSWEKMINNNGPKGSPKWFISKFGKDTQHVCAYMRDLLGVASRVPRTRPDSPNCPSTATGQFGDSDF